MTLWYLLAFVYVALGGAGVTKLLMHLRATKLMLCKHRLKHTSKRLGQPSEVPYLDEVELQHKTQELLSLGFGPIGDVVSQHRDPLKQNSAETELERKTHGMQGYGFARIFAHSTVNCNASLAMAVTIIVPNPRFQLTESQKQPTVTALRVDIVSRSGHGAARWSYHTHNREFKAIARLWAQPRSLWTRIIGATPEKLLRAHLERRSIIAQHAGIEWNRSATIEEHMIYEDEMAAHIRDTMNRQSVLGFAFKRWRYKRQPINEWMGELSGRL